MIKIALTKGRIEKKMCELLEKANYDVEPIINKNRELKVETKDGIEIIFVKSNDVITYVDRGIVDLGIVGSDTLLENENKNYKNILDLNIGKCIFAVCSYPDYATKEINRKRIIATKYPNVAVNFYKSKKQDIDIVKLDGSVELGPVVGMTDAIVDIVETGETLRANGLEIIEKVCDVSTQMISGKNISSDRIDEVNEFVRRIRAQIA